MDISKKGNFKKWGLGPTFYFFLKKLSEIITSLIFLFIDILLIIRSIKNILILEININFKS